MTDGRQKQKCAWNMKESVVKKNKKDNIEKKNANHSTEESLPVTEKLLQSYSN